MLKHPPLRLLFAAAIALSGCGRLLARSAPADVLACADAGAVETRSAGNPKPGVIPTLQQWRGGEGPLVLQASGRIVLEPASADRLQAQAALFQARLHQVSGLSLPIVRSATPRPGDIALGLHPCGDALRRTLGAEGYSLSLRKAAVLRAGTPTGLFYATQTLLQMLALDTRSPWPHTQLSQGEAVDYPRYKERSVLFDVGRKFADKAFLEAYIRFMAWYKLNTLHLHLNDQAMDADGRWGLRAFRLKSDKPAFAGLVPTGGQYYTRQDWDELEQVAAAYGVQIVPEIDTPGHAGAFALAHPAIAYDGDQPPGGTIDPTRPATLAYVESVFREFLPWFKSSRIHIGGDEINLQSAAIPVDDQVAYLNRLGRFLLRQGKTVEMWGDGNYLAARPGLDRRFVIQRWINWGDEAALNWKRQGFAWTESYGDFYVVPFGPDYFNPGGLRGDTLYDRWHQHAPEGADAPSGGQISVWNDKALLHAYTYEQTVNDLLKDAVPAAGQLFWRGRETDAAGAVVPYSALRPSVGVLQYGPDVRMFDGSPIPAR